MSPLARLLERRLHLRSKKNVHVNPPAYVLTRDAVAYREAIELPSGALATWGPKYATGRIPQDTYTVKHEDSTIDWSQPNNHAMTPRAFDMLFNDALSLLQSKRRLYVTDRTVGADPRYALPVRVITDAALPALFTYELFRPTPSDLPKSVFTAGFTLLFLPHDRIDAEQYRGVLREEKGKIVEHAIAMDIERRMGVVIGTSYLGAVKKTLFTTMNALLPQCGVLPLHCGAVEDAAGACHLFLGLSGTGKTTLTSAPGLTLIGDDEHLWSDDGIANMENGCYAKLIRLSTEKEPEIYDATFGDCGENDVPPIIENAMVFPNGTIDLNDDRLTENSRAAYSLSRLPRSKPSARGTHPSTIIFLTADARGILPPVAKLPLKQALLWFMLGYTSKLAGTETDIKEPTSTFSRFFGGAFMPLSSEAYLTLFQEKIQEHRPDIYLMNTGWSGGPSGVGKRMDITLTRSIVSAALTGRLRDVPYREDALFHLLVPKECPGVDSSVLDPRRTWPDPQEYDAKAKALAAEFAAHFEKLAKSEMVEALGEKCPGA